MNQLIRWIKTVRSVSTHRAGVDTPQAKTPEWYLNRATGCMTSVNSQVSHPTKVKLYFRQCTYLANELETAIQKSRQALDRSSSPEHRAECGGALKLLYQLEKEVESFIRECCHDKTWMQAALTSATVPERVSLWRCHLKVCTELLCNNNKLGEAWLTIAQIGGLEVVEIEQMAWNDEGDLMRLLESQLCHSSEVQPHVFMGNDDPVSFLLERLNARQAMPIVGSPQWSDWVNRGGVRPWKVASKTFQRGKIIGHGSTSSVYKGDWFGAIGVAIKDIKYPGKHMLGIAAWPSHPNVASCLGYMVNEERCSMILELMDEDLRTLMDRKMQEDANREGPFSVWAACDIMLQVAEGVRYMHRNRVLHGDLQPRNIVVKSSKDDADEHVCAKVDAGCAKRIEKSTSSYTVQTHKGVTTRWMAPELMNHIGRFDISSISAHEGLKYPFKLDVYSFGMLFYVILTGELPFGSLLGEGSRDLTRKVLNGFRPTLPETLPQSVRNLIKLCWDPEHIIRPSFDEICEELRYIRCSLLLEPQDHMPELPLRVLEPLQLPLQVSKFKGDYSSLKVVRKLGTGGSDIVTVYLSTWLQPEIKRVAQKRFMGSHNECFINEVSIMAGLKHSNVVRLLYYASDRRSCSIVMELMDEDLHNLMERRRLDGKLTPTGPFSIEDAIHIILQIAQGMEYVHKEYVVHRDLKSCNILVKIPTTGGRLEVKVADFGLSTKLPSQSTLLNKEDSGVGTTRWMAPELTLSAYFKSSSYDPFKSDLFSFGMVCYEILVGRVPFYEEVQDLDKVRKKVLSSERPPLPEWTPSDLMILIEKCWLEEPSKRPTFTDIVKRLTTVRV